MKRQYRHAGHQVSVDTREFGRRRAMGGRSTRMVRPSLSVFDLHTPATTRAG